MTPLQWLPYQELQRLMGFIATYLGYEPTSTKNPRSFAGLKFLETTPSLDLAAEIKRIFSRRKDVPPAILDAIEPIVTERKRDAHQYSS